VAGRDHRASPDALSAFAAVVLAGAAALVLAPALVGGVALGEVLRRRRLRWTWALLAAPLTALGAVLTARKAPAFMAAPTSDPADVLSVTGPAWLAVLPIVTGLWKLHRDRRDRLHGGRAERELDGAQGPLELLSARRRAAEAFSAGPYGAQGVLLGSDERGAPVRVPELVAHATIVGASNSGKTNTAEVLLEAHVAAGRGFVILDGKGGRDLPRAALALAARYHRPLALWSVLAYDDAELDGYRRAWNPAADGNPTQIKDRIASCEPQTEPYYAAVAARGLLAAAQLLAATTPQVRLDALADLLDQPADLSARLAAHDQERFTSEVAWLAGASEAEQSGLRGMAVRLRTLVASDGGHALLPPGEGSDLRLYEAVRDGHLIVFTLPQGLYPELIPRVARYALAALNAVCTRLEAEGRKGRSLVFVDELSALDGDELCAGYERGRSAGVPFMVATQSLSNFASAGGDKLLHAALDNAELIVVHRQAVPDAAELLASLAGTEEAWEHTHKVHDAPVPLGLDESGQRARRLTDRFRAHPNSIKQLALGQAILVSHRPTFAIQQIRVRAGISARRASAPGAPGDS